MVRVTETSFAPRLKTGNARFEKTTSPIVAPPSNRTAAQARSSVRRVSTALVFAALLIAGAILYPAEPGKR
ncbi:MAG: hypothetical protein HGA75_17225 [Thiobacillus sp.]|nr:hypothetical protein [Thiobacillus sp.]